MLQRAASAFFIFAALYVTYCLHSLSSRDPTSIFFNPRTGYKPSYSAIRAEQAETFIATAGNHSAIAPNPSTGVQKKLCVGIPSIARKGARYLRTAVGSLLQGLSPEERAEIHLIVFIPHSDPTIHPAYTEQWLPNLADDILVYDVDDRQMQHIKEMEAEGGLYREKGLYDYSYLLRACYAQATPYIAIFEDDIVAMDGWYHRTQAALEQAEALSALKKATPEFLYLRLFHTEEFFGWNSEEWFTYLVYSALFVGLVVAVLAALRRVGPHGRRIIPDRVVLASFPTCVAVILVFFSLGRVTVRPAPTGVVEMPKYGCCSQGFVFPREKAMTLVKWFEEKKVGFVDVLTEEYADQHGELRWAIMPSVIQHVGRKSSKVDDYGPESKHGLSVAEKIWNFRFERYNPLQLKKEHSWVSNE